MVASKSDEGSGSDDNSDLVFAPAHMRRCHPLAMGVLVERGETDEANAAGSDAYIEASSEEAKHLGSRFDAETPPTQDSWVPSDSVWAFFPYPGPMPSVSGFSMRKKFAQIGTLRGRPFGEILAVVGQPNNRLNDSDGIVATWTSVGLVACRS